jgi:hypothetical protein
MCINGPSNIKIKSAVCMAQCCNEIRHVLPPGCVDRRWNKLSDRLRQYLKSKLKRVLALKGRVLSQRITPLSNSSVWVFLKGGKGNVNSRGFIH